MTLWGYKTLRREEEQEAHASLRHLPGPRPRTKTLTSLTLTTPISSLQPLPRMSSLSTSENLSLDFPPWIGCHPTSPYLFRSNLVMTSLPILVRFRFPRGC
jgi:hypothetical protein